MIWHGTDSVPVGGPLADWVGAAGRYVSRAVERLTPQGGAVGVVASPAVTRDLAAAHNFMEGVSQTVALRGNDERTISVLQRIGDAQAALGRFSATVDRSAARLESVPRAALQDASHAVAKLRAISSSLE